jgi:hypothetical protein
MNPAVWLESALDQLADIWVQVDSAERTRIEAAVNRINAELARDPSGAGESRAGGNRILCSLPITVRFRVEPGPVAVVYHVHHVRSRP